MTYKTDPVLLGIMDNNIKTAGLALDESRSAADVAKNRVSVARSETETEAYKRRAAEDELVRAKRETGDARASERKQIEKNRQLTEALSQKEELMKEWMHSNEAFKRLARKYGKKLGVSDEQRQNDLDDCVLEVAEEKPEFANTNNLKAAKEARGIK